MTQLPFTVGKMLYGPTRDHKWSGEHLLCKYLLEIDSIRSTIWKRKNTCFAPPASLRLGDRSWVGLSRAGIKMPRPNMHKPFGT